MHTLKYSILKLRHKVALFSTTCLSKTTYCLISTSLAEAKIYCYQNSAEKIIYSVIDFDMYLLVHIHCSHIANQMLYNGCCKTRSEKLSSRALLPYHVIKPNHAKPLMLITSNMAIGQVLCNSNIRWRSKISSHQP